MAMGYDVTDRGASRLVTVTPSDTVSLAEVCRALWVGGAGNIAILADDDSAAVLISGVPAGTVLPIRARRVNLTNTTATLITALY